jgi:hypothetical protein
VSRALKLLPLLLAAPVAALAQSAGVADEGVPAPAEAAPPDRALPTEPAARQAPMPDAGTPPGTHASAPDAGMPAGPVLQLEGLGELASPASEEKDAAAAQATAEKSFRERLQPTATLAERAASILDRTTLGGYSEHDLIVPRDGDTTFRNHRYVLFVYSHISERISTATEVEFEFGGSPLKRDGVLGAGEVLLEFSVVDLEIARWLIFRAGVILVPVGVYNLRHDAPAQELPERPIAYTTVVPTTWFESGAGFLGEVDLGGMVVGYELYAVNGLDARILDVQGFRAARGSHLEDNNSDKAITGRVFVSPSLGLEMGVSGYTGAYDDQGRRANLVNADLFWRLGRVDLTGEVVRAFIDPGFVQGFSADSPANTRSRVPTGMSGFYAQVNYRFGIEPLFRLFPPEWRDGHFTATVRYEEKDTDTDFVTAGDAARLTLGLNFRPLPPYVLKQSFHFEKNGTDGSGRPHAWRRRFWEEPSYEYIASVAFLF